MFQWLADRRHRAFRENLSAYMDGALSTREKRRLEDHLSECAACRRELDELRAVVDAVRRLPEAPVPRSFAIEPAAAPRPVPARRPNFAFGAVSAAALVLFAALLGGDLLTQSGGGPGTEEASDRAMPMLQGELEGAEMDDGSAPKAEEMAPSEAATPATAAGAAVEEPESEAPAPRAPGVDETAPTPAPADEESRALAEEDEGAGSGRTVLRVLEVVAGAVFLAALAGAVWMRRRGDMR